LRSSCRRWLSSVSRLSFSSAIDCFLLLPLSLLRISYGPDMAAVVVCVGGELSVSERAREGGERQVVIAGERRCVGVTRRVCDYASRQCKIIYGLYWRNRHRSAPARSGYGHHVKCGSCDMPLRRAKSRPGQHRSGGLRASRMVRLCVDGRRRGASAVAAVGEARARVCC
jgi:hypothetical protein